MKIIKSFAAEIIKKGIIGTTKINPEHELRYRVCFPDDSGRDVSNFHSEINAAIEDFEQAKIDTGDVHLFISLIKSEEDEETILDEELIDSFWEEDEDVA